MKSENKLGLVVASAFLALTAVVLGMKMREPPDAPDPGLPVHSVPAKSEEKKASPEPSTPAEWKLPPAVAPLPKEEAVKAAPLPPLKEEKAPAPLPGLSAEPRGALPPLPIENLPPELPSGLPPVAPGMVPSVPPGKLPPAPPLVEGVTSELSGLVPLPATTPAIELVGPPAPARSVGEVLQPVDAKVAAPPAPLKEAMPVVAPPLPGLPPPDAPPPSGLPALPALPMGPPPAVDIPLAPPPPETEKPLPKVEEKRAPAPLPKVEEKLPPLPKVEEKRSPAPLPDLGLTSSGRPMERAAFIKEAASPGATLKAPRPSELKVDPLVKPAAGVETVPVPPPAKFVPVPDAKPLPLRIESAAAGVGDTWDTVSRRFYGDARCTEALKAFNRDYPFSSRQVKETGLFAAGETLYIPPMGTLVDRYPSLIAPSAGTPAAPPSASVTRPF